MQIDRVTRGAIFIAAIILGLVLISPQIFPVPGPGTGNAGAVPAGPALSPVATAMVTTPAATGTFAATPATETGRVMPAGSPKYHAELNPAPEISLSRPGNVTISGTTDAPAGTLLWIDFIAVSMHPSPMEYNPELWFGADATVTEQERDEGSWSVEVRPQDFRKPDRWQVIINDKQSGRTIGSGYINVTA